MAATRLPGKPLLKINDLSIISHVFKRAEEANIGEVVVATEDQEILEDVIKNGGRAILTSKNHKTGTDRIYEAFQKLEVQDVDLIMNLQGDEPAIDIAALMAMGDVTAGEKIFKKCAACHSIVKGGKNKIGPALYNVVERKVGGVEDYKYSKALAAYDKNWTFEELNGFLKKPAKYIKGTKMAYAGLRKETDRASIIKYLNQNSDNPVPLP